MNFFRYWFDVLMKISQFDVLSHFLMFISDENIIGEDGYGIVYKGVLEDGSIVAVKNFLNNEYIIYRFSNRFYFFKNIFCNFCGFCVKI